MYEKKRKKVKLTRVTNGGANCVAALEEPHDEPWADEARGTRDADDFSLDNHSEVVKKDVKMK